MASIVGNPEEGVSMGSGRPQNPTPVSSWRATRFAAFGAGGTLVEFRARLTDCVGSRGLGYVLQV